MIEEILITTVVDLSDQTYDLLGGLLHRTDY